MECNKDQYSFLHAEVFAREEHSVEGQRQDAKLHDGQQHISITGTGDQTETFMRHCTLCPRNCGVDRTAGETGYCGMTDELRVARAALHHWEEPCLSGARGSGTVFFSGCPMRCVYCQNQPIAEGRAGKSISIARLTEIFLELQQQGAHNINLVTPTHFIPQIRSALLEAKKQGLCLPVVYNTSGYEKPSSLRLLDGLIDVYLPDLKYIDREPAQRYSNAPDYFVRASSALAEMYQQVGKPRFDADGIMQRGIIVRHLVLPGRVRDAKRIVRYLLETYGDRIYISLMSQFTPLAPKSTYPELAHKLPEEAYARLIDYACRLGLKNGFIQEGGAATESFIPPFDGEGV